MTSQRLFERFSFLFPQLVSEVVRYKDNRMEKNSIVIFTKGSKRWVFTSESNKDSLIILHS